MKTVSVMKSTLGRLPIYLEYLISADAEGCENISATMIAKALGLGEVQVRKDLSAVSGAGRPKLGYKRNELIKRLESVLGKNKTTKAIIVGAGKLGNALLEYKGFSEYGLELVAGFDIDEKKIGKTESGKDIFPLTALGEYCRENTIEMGIITVPSSSAQTICDVMTGNGVTAIWNFAPCTLDVPDGVLLSQENLALSLAHLKIQMRNK